MPEVEQQGLKYPALKLSGYLALPSGSRASQGLSTQDEIEQQLSVLSRAIRK